MPNSIELKINDLNNNEINVKNSSLPIKINIENNQLNSNNQFKRVNITSMNLSSTKNKQLFVISSFSVSALNSSLNFQIEPISSNLSYLIIVSLGNEIIFNPTSQFFDFYKILCPNSSKFFV